MLTCGCAEYEAMLGPLNLSFLPFLFDRHPCMAGVLH